MVAIETDHMKITLHPSTQSQRAKVTLWFIRPDQLVTLNDNEWLSLVRVLKMLTAVVE